MEKIEKDKLNTVYSTRGGKIQKITTLQPSQVSYPWNSITKYLPHSGHNSSTTFRFGAFWANTCNPEQVGSEELAKLPGSKADSSRTFH